MSPIRDFENVQQHIVVLGWLYIVVNAFILALGTFLFLLLSGIGLTIADVEARSVLLIVGPTVGGLVTLLAVPGLAAGYGLLTHKPWARVLAIVMAILGLVNFPLGTAIGVYALWVLVAMPRPASYSTNTEP